ncbi:MAG: helix-turn-helix domain-containing protein [Alphaproteobacteria bacterium]
MDALSIKESNREVDEHVGNKLRVRRSLMGMSQEKLAEQAGITFQQIQKYERGKNRISSSRLYQFSHILNVPVNYFFPDNDANQYEIAGMADNKQDEFDNGDSLAGDIMNEKETIKLVRAYYEIKDENIRQSVLNHIKALSSKTCETS